MFGSIHNFTAIINPPQAAILAIGGTRNELSTDAQPVSRFTVTLCYDARAISGSSAHLFLNHLSKSLSDPEFMLLEPVNDNSLNFDFTKLL
ncbi:unnamed protein product, partial [Mesorhabditis spiculigera]